jgi:hypothetical protein
METDDALSATGAIVAQLRMSAPSTDLSAASFPLTGSGQRSWRIVPHIAFVLFASTGTVVGNAEPPQPMLETSVVLVAQRPQHRRVSIREARLIALEAVHRANQRRQAFAERESLEFAALFGEREG